MSILKIARLGHPVLRTLARPLEENQIKGQVIQELIDDMIETMHEYQGIGLAAPQIHESFRIFVAGIESKPEDEQLSTTVFINPEVVALDSSKIEDWEGCLSIPDMRGRVLRSANVRIRSLDRRGEFFEKELRGYSSRVVQHELDHLDGILFLDRMTSFESLSFLEEFERFWRNEVD